MALRDTISRTIGVGIPFSTFHVVNRDKGWLTPHGQSHVAGNKFFIDFLAKGINQHPLLIAVRFRDARIFVNPLHRVAVIKFNLALPGRPGHRGGT